jgi:hypothetical protein
MKSGPTESGAEILAGLVERVTFHNEENGFAVLRVKARGKRDLVTVVGHAAVISAGEFIHASVVQTTVSLRVKAQSLAVVTASGVAPTRRGCRDDGSAEGAGIPAASR